jgi:hypothetical protein
MLKLAIALVAVAVILAGLLAGLPARALDGTPSPNILPPTNPHKCWVATGNIADVFARCADAPATPVQRPAVTPESGHTAEQPDRKSRPSSVCWHPGMSRNNPIAIPAGCEQE